MKNFELLLIPSPGVGHLVSTLELAKLLVHVNTNLSITVLIIKPPNTTHDDDNQFLHDRIRFINLLPPHQDRAAAGHKFIDSQKPQVKETATNIINGSNNSILAGFIVDMFCTSMIDVAEELGVPTYVFFTSSAATLGLTFYFQTLYDNGNFNFNITAATQSKGSSSSESESDGEAVLPVPSFLNPLPVKVVPANLFRKDRADEFALLTRRFRRTKGIMVNSFLELEPHALSSFVGAENIPPVYPVGPILNLGTGGGDDIMIMKWLDDQPPKSVVFLCFGSMGSFGEEQVKEIAYALEESGHRFLWSLRKPQEKGSLMPLPTEYTNFEQVLSAEFLNRTAEIGKVIGWAPQVNILAHPAIGGFVSHCGWNSTLESLWFGVPIAAWPMYAEQQANAFELVVDLGLAVEIKMDYQKDLTGAADETIVSSKDIKRGIMQVMEKDSVIRKRVTEIRENSRNASVMSGGSSHSALSCFIDNVIKNIS